MTRWEPTPADRDERGRIRLDPLGHRSLADLLPPLAAPNVQPDRADRTSVVVRADVAPTLRARLAGAVIALLVVVILAVIVASTRPRSAPMQPAPTAAPAPAPTTVPTAALAPRMIVAWWEPDGQALPGPIAERDASHVVGRLGADWIQVGLRGGGLVWVRRADLHLGPNDLAALARAPDLTPPTPTPIAAAPPVAVEAPELAAAPTATPLAVPPMRFPADAPDYVPPAPRRIREKPLDRTTPHLTSERRVP